MVSRRDVLIGAGALIAVGAASAVEMGSRRRTSLLHRLGLVDSPDKTFPDSHTPVESGTLQSDYMSTPVGWSMSRPSGALTGVVYCLHGRDEDHRFTFDDIHLPDAAAYVGAKVAIAAVDGGSDRYWHPRADGQDPQAMLLDEFIPMIERRVATRRRALLGWSMGGYGALLAAETEPDRFRAVAAASPALWTTPDATPEGAFDDADDFERNDVFRGAPRLEAMTVRIDCGKGDPFVSASRQFADDLQHQPETSFGAGFHDAAYWRSVAPRQLRTIDRVFRR
jgi:S-formylglutathione hydrolase FrmB